MKKRSLAILLTLLLTLSLTACGGSSATSGGSYYANGKSSYDAAMASTPAEAPVPEGYWADEPAEAEETVESGESRAELPDGVKMIYTAGLELETTEFEKAAADIKGLTQSLGGYFEEQNTYNRSGGYRNASYTVRVPAARFDAFLSQIGSVCTVVHQSQNAEDVSEYYYDMESRLETAKIKLDRLQELLSRAEEMEDIITLENAISDVEYQIEKLSGEKRHYDALIDYSTIHITLNEVYRITEVETAPLTFGQRIGIAFRDGLRNFGDMAEDFLEWLAYSWLSLLVLLAIIVVVVKLIRRAREKRPLKNDVPRKGLFRRKAKEPETTLPRDVTDKDQ